MPDSSKRPKMTYRINSIKERSLLKSDYENLLPMTISLTN